MTIIRSRIYFVGIALIAAFAPVQAQDWDRSPFDRLARQVENDANVVLDGALASGGRPTNDRRLVHSLRRFISGVRTLQDDLGRGTRELVSADLSRLNDMAADIQGRLSEAGLGALRTDWERVRLRLARMNDIHRRGRGDWRDGRYDGRFDGRGRRGDPVYNLFRDITDR